MQFKEDLTFSTCGSQPITKFLQAMKIIVDELAIIANPILDEDLTIFIFNGLGP